MYRPHLSLILGPGMILLLACTPAPDRPGDQATGPIDINRSGFLPGGLSRDGFLYQMNLPALNSPRETEPVRHPARTRVLTDGEFLFLEREAPARMRMIHIASGSSEVVESSRWRDLDHSQLRTLPFARHENEIFIADTARHVLRRVDLATGRLDLLAGSDQAIGSRDGRGRAALCHHPSRMAYMNGKLYVVDTGNHMIRRVDPRTGIVSTLAGNGTSGTRDGIGRGATFSFPIGIVAQGRRLYVADGGNFAVRRIQLETKEVLTIPASELPGDAGDADNRAYFECLQNHHAWCRPVAPAPGF